MFLCPEIFKTGTARSIYVVLRNHPLLYHLFKVAVDSRCPNRNPLPFKKATDICNRYMCPFYGLQIGQDLFHLDPANDYEELAQEQNIVLANFRRKKLSQTGVRGSNGNLGYLTFDEASYLAKVSRSLINKWET